MDDTQAARGAFAELSVSPVCQDCASRKPDDGQFDVAVIGHSANPKDTIGPRRARHRHLGTLGAARFTDGRPKRCDGPLVFDNELDDDN